MSHTVALNVGCKRTEVVFTSQRPRNLGGHEHWVQSEDLPFSGDKQSRNIFHLPMAGGAFSQAFLVKTSSVFHCHLLEVLGRL